MEASTSEALVRDLHRAALARVLYAEEADGAAPPEAGGHVVVEHEGGVRTEHVLDPPDPDDHRIAHASRELVPLVQGAVAAAITVTLKGVPDPHEVLLVCAAHRDGAALSCAVHAIPTSDGVLAPGPQAPVDGVAAALPEVLLAALRPDA